MSGDVSTLVQLLGAIDGTFAPLRQPEMPQSSSFSTARYAYFKSGLEIRGGGARRMAFSRAIDQLSLSGQLTVRRNRKSRFPTIRLTDAAEDRTRCIVGLPSIREAWDFTERIAKLSAENDPRRPLVPEWVLADWSEPRGFTYPSEDMSTIVGIQQTAAPALCRGWLMSCSTRSGHVCYRILPAGRAALEASPPDDFYIDELYDEQAFPLWLKAFNNVRHALMNANPPDPNNIGEHPRSPDALRWPVKEGIPCF